MVQIIGTPNKRSFGQSFIKGAAETLPDALGSLIDRKRRESQLAGEDEALEAQGIHTKGIRDPNLRKALLEQHGENLRAETKFNAEKLKKFEEQNIENQRSKAIGKFFGPQAGELYNHLTEGGKSLLTQYLLDDKRRNEDLNDSLGNFVKENPDAIESNASPLEQLLNPRIEKQWGKTPQNTEEQLPGLGNPNVQQPKSVGRTPKEKVKEEQLEKKAKSAEALQKRKEELEFHKESKAYDEEIRESAKRAKAQEKAFKDIAESIKGGVKPGSVYNILKDLGTVGDKIAKAFKTGEQGQFEAALPILLEGWKEVFGVRLSDADLLILQNKIPDVGNSPEANEAILKILQKYTKAPLMREKVASEIKKANKGLRPLGYEDQVEAETDRRLAEESEPNEQIPFDRNNPYHIKRRQQILDSVGGDKNAANQILMREFTK